MLPRFHGFRVVFKGIRSPDIDLTDVLLGHGLSIFPWLRVARWRRCPVCVNCQNIQNKLLTYKINLKSITKFCKFESRRGMDVCFYECWGLSEKHLCDGSITILDEIYNLCVCVSVFMC